jgi:hypothetical protein
VAAMNSRRFYVNEVRLGPDTYRVMHPARPINHGTLYEEGWGAEMFVDKAARVDFALAWWLAARSPHTLVYLPLRSGECNHVPEYCKRKLDLALMHHSLGFPPSRWKDVRAKLTPTGLQKVTLPETPFRAIERDERMRSWRRDFRDNIRYAFAADTLFLTGSREAYELQSEDVSDLLAKAPAELATDPGKHVCAEIEMGQWRGRGPTWGRRNDPLRLHVTCCNKHW